MAVLADVTKRTIREASDKTCNIGAMTKNQVFCIRMCCSHVPIVQGWYVARRS